MSLRFYLFVSDVDPGNEEFMCKKVDSRFAYVAQGMGRFYLDLPQAVKKEYTLEVGFGCVWNLLSQAKVFLTL